MTSIKTLFLAALIIPLIACDRSSTVSSNIKKYPPVDVEMVLQKVSDNVVYVQGKAGIATDNAGFISNAGAVITDEGIVIFDALGSPSLAHKFYKQLREMTDKPIKKVIVSHYHADHIYGLQVFKELGAEIVAPYGSLDYINSPLANERLEERRFSLEPWVNEQTQIVYPDQLLKADTKFALGGHNFTLNVLGVAHSDGDLTMYVEPDGVLFSGDIIFEGRIPFLGDANTRTWLETLQRMETSQVTALIPGHGPVAKNPNQAITATRTYLAFMREKMGNAAQDFVAFADAYANTDWSTFKDLPAFEEANRRNAFQVYLSMEAEMLKD